MSNETSKTAEPTVARAAAGYADLTAAERAALSNSICGNAEVVRSLERKGLVTNVVQGGGQRREIAYFDLTPEGEAIHREHFQFGGESA